MSSCLRIVLIAGCLLGNALAGIALGQQTPASATPDVKGLVVRPPEAVETRDSSGRKVQRIMLDVVVTDASGKPVSGLTREDFRLLENGEPKPIVSFGAADSASANDPVQAILLVDTVNNSFENVAAERRAIEIFLGRDGGRLPFPVSIVLFADNGAQVDRASRDGKVLIAELKKTITAIPTIDSAMGAGGAIERFQRSLKVLRQLIAFEGPQPGRKLLLWFGPGWPMLSSSHFGSSERDRHANWEGIVSFSTDLRRTRMTLYSIDSLSLDPDVDRSIYYQNFLKPVTLAQRAVAANLALPVLAVQSGGMVASRSNDVAAEIANCLEEGKASYTIAYDALPSEQPNEYRWLEVKVGKPGMVARTTSGYYAQPGSF